MGKLAERYGDSARSGVYRVRDARIPLAAAAEANAMVLELGVAALANGGWPLLEQALALGRAGARVVLVPDAGALALPENRGVLEALGAAAQSCREAGRPFFAVLVDPGATLALPALYKERVRK